jgi:hypothetical protein
MHVTHYFFDILYNIDEEIKIQKLVNIIALPHLNFWSTKKSFWHFIYVGADNGTVSTSGTW